jgi:Ulp1 family protease
VVNPGAILNNVKALNKDPGDDKPYPCILFFDSLKAHPKAAIARKVRNWLNSEWKRLEKASNQVVNQDKSKPFQPTSLLVHNPKGEILGCIVSSSVTVSLNGISCTSFPFSVPYQKNGWDCGMFVCRYAHALYSMRDCDITFRDARKGHGREPFQQAITDNKAFHFGEDDIVRIRTELGTLIGRLSTIYKTRKDAMPTTRQKR